MMMKEVETSLPQTVIKMTGINALFVFSIPPLRTPFQDQPGERYVERQNDSSHSFHSLDDGSQAALPFHLVGLYKNHSSSVWALIVSSESLVSPRS